MRRKYLLGSGIVASALYVVTDLLGAATYPGYSYADHTISELSAIGAASRPIVVPLFGLYVPLMLAFAAGVWLIAANRRVLHVVAALLGAYALACIPFAPMHTRELLAAGGATWSDTLHLVMTGIDSLLLLAIIALGATTLGNAFRIYSIVTLIIVAAAGLYTGTFADSIAANMPTPWAGAMERVAVHGSMLWIAVFAVATLRRLEPARWSLRAFVGRHPALTYFVLTFMISWGGILLVIGGPGNVFASPDVFLSYVWVAPLVLGPTIAGIFTTWLVNGRFGLRSYARRLLRWRVDARWYAVALLLAPTYFVVVAMVLSLSSTAYLPGIATATDRASLLVQGMVIGLTAGIFEELGWTGFAVPALRRRFTPTQTGLIVGVVWGLWHVLPETLGANALEFMPYLGLQLVTVVIGLTGFRILMTWVFDRTHSTLIGILMHLSLTASLLILQPLVSGRSLMVVAVALDLTPWIIVGAVVLATRLHTRPTLRWPTSPTPRPAL